MWRRALWFGSVMTVCVVGSLGCGKKPAAGIDAGTFEGSVYHNKYLGFRLTVPDDWSVQDEEAKRRFRQTGEKILAGDSESVQAAVEAGHARAVDLFTVFQYPFGSPVPYNPSLSGIAESLAHAPGVQTGGDYLYHVRRLLEGAQLRSTFPGEVYDQTLGGVAFHVLAAEVSVAGVTVHQEYYATVRKGYALVLTISYSNDDTRDALRAILQTATFAPMR